MNFIIDKNADKTIIDNLSLYGNVYFSTEIDLYDKSLASHPDLQIHFINENSAFVTPETYDYYKEILPGYINVYKGLAKTFGTYQNLCAYNIARVGNKIIANTKFADKTILNYYIENDYRIIHVNQGYTKCNICSIADKLILTEDEGIYASLIKNNVCVELINRGDVELYGFEYGFFGGATGYAENNLFLSGKINNLFNLEKIGYLAKIYNFNVVELSHNRLYDYGSIISFI